MIPLAFGIVIGVAAVATFVLSQGRRGWFMAVLGILCLFLGAGSTWLIEKGPQKFFAHARLVTPARVTAAMPWLTVAGLGILSGALVRGAFGALKKRPETPSGADVDTPANSNTAV